MHEPAGSATRRHEMWRAPPANTCRFGHGQLPVRPCLPERAKRLGTLLEWHDEVRLKPDPHRVGMSGA